MLQVTNGFTGVKLVVGKLRLIELWADHGNGNRGLSRILIRSGGHLGISEKIKSLNFSEKFIAVVGVIVSVASVIVSWKQYEAADLQAKVSVAQLAPQLILSRELFDDYKSEWVLISNDGGPIYNLGIKYYSWITLQSKAKGELGAFVLADYLGQGAASGSAKGEVGRIPGDDNKIALIKLRKGLHVRGIDVNEVGLVVELTYSDSLGRSVVDYYSSSGHYFSKYFDEKLGKKKFEELGKLNDCKRLVWVFLADKDAYFDELLERINLGDRC